MVYYRLYVSIFMEQGVHRQYFVRKQTRNTRFRRDSMHDVVGLSTYRSYDLWVMGPIV